MFCLSDNEDELKHNGYVLYNGNSLKDYKLRFVQDIDVLNKTERERRDGKSCGESD